MIQPRPGEVWWIDLGAKAKFRPMMVVSREDPNPERALSVCVPCTKGVANVLEIEAVEHYRFDRRAGRYEAAVISAVRQKLAWMLELS
jgi:mRNA-degrading endonuclease toxin of MazEF toxin-antitoxin module